MVVDQQQTPSRVPQRPEAHAVRQLRRRRRPDRGVVWVMRGACPPLLSAAAGKSALMAGTLNPALGAGLLLATLAFALATIERTEWWPDRSRLVATFRMPAFLKQRPVQMGDLIPEATLVLPSSEDPKPSSFVSTRQIFRGQRVVLLSTPMAFSPGCSNIHIPDWRQALPKLAVQGTSLAVVSMDTPFAMAAWAKSFGVDDDMLFLSDPKGMLGKSLGATFDAGPFGVRGRRYAMLLDNLEIRAWQLEETGELTCSTADIFLESIAGL